jgi:hypothetical protein
MRVVFVPPSDKQWVHHYARHQTGKGFDGLPYQRGGGLGNIFRGIFRFLLPIAKKAGKAVGKQALRTGSQIASDVVAGEDLKKAVNRRSKTGASALLKKAAKKVGQKGGRRKKSTIKGGKKKKRVTRKKKQQDQFGAYYK